MAYLLFLVPACIWFFWESDWGRCPDKSPHRVAVYLAYFWIFPVAIASFIIHLIVTCSSPRHIKTGIAVAAVCGFAGLVTLHLFIHASPDPEAEMGYLGLPIFFSAFALAGFVVSVLWLHLRDRIRKRGRNS